MRVRRRAKVQRAVLRRLVDGQPVSVSALTASTSFSRPSVSRALAALERMGLAERVGREWAIADAGLNEARRLWAPPVPTVAQVLGDFALPALQADALRAFQVVPRNLDSLVTRAVKDLQVTLPTMTLDLVRGAFASAATIDVQRVLAAYNSLAVDSFTLAELAVPQGRILAGLASINDALARQGSLVAEADAITRRTATVAAAFSAHAEVILADAPRVIPATLAVPAEATADFVESAAEVVTPRGHTIATDDPADLGRLLHEVAPRLATMWSGAWEAAGSSNPDRFRQAAHSARELLMQTVKLITPRGSPATSRRERVIAIVGADSETLQAWAVATSEHAVKTCDLFSAEAHSHDDQTRFTTEALYGVLEATGGLLRLLIACAQSSAREDTNSG